MSPALLEIEDLSIHFGTPNGVAKVVSNVNIAVEAGEMRGLVGESGSGKSVTARSILSLHPRRALAYQGGVIRYRGRDLSSLSETDLQRSIRGVEISMVFQDPMTALNPVIRVGNQIMRPLRQHLGLSRADAKAKALRLLSQVGVSHPEERLLAFPHELSGGQRQRVMIAIALSCDPKLLIADEPTTALDVTVQAQIVDLLGQLRDELGLAILLISHDLTLIAERCEVVSVMYAGRIVEEGPAAAVFGHPDHPYTAMLEMARPRYENPPHTVLQTIPGLPPDLISLPGGCSFHSRCPRGEDDCTRSLPEPISRIAQRSVACLHPGTLRGGLGLPVDRGPAASVTRDVMADGKASVAVEVEGAGQ